MLAAKLLICWQPSLLFPRVQGSNDGVTWADLRRHIGDGTIRMPGQYASWAVSGPAAAVPYRMFRLLLVGPNPEAANKHHVCLSYWELYGYLYKRTVAAAAGPAGGAAAAAAAAAAQPGAQPT